jgi:hypothetical protein
VSGLRRMTAEEAIHAEEMVSEEVGRPCGGNWHTHEQVWAAGGRVPAGGEGDGRMLDGLTRRRTKRRCYRRQQAGVGGQWQAQCTVRA